MNSLYKKRKQLYHNLVTDGYFRDTDGKITISEHDFCILLDQESVVCKLYSNLLNDGYFRDEDGKVITTESAFVDSLTKAEPLKEYYPITENQRGLYIDWEQHRDSLQYNTPIAIRFSKNRFEAVRFVEALKSVVSAHPYIMTRLALRGDDVVQLQRNDATPNVLYEKHAEEPDHSFFQSRVRPFDLFNEDLYRIEVYETEEYTYLFQDFHHIIFDGFSIGVFLSDLMAAYRGNELEGEDATSFDFAVMEAENKGSAKWEEANKYFATLLSDAESLDYPDSTKDESGSASGSGRVNATIQHGNAIKSYCQEKGITESNYFMTVMLEVLHRLTREENFVTCFVSSGRNSNEYMHTLGMFVKTLPVVMQSSCRKAAVTFADLAKEVQAQTMSTISRDFYPFTEMVERYGVRPNVLYAYQGGLFDDDQGDDESGIKLLESLTLSTTKVPLDISFSPDGTGNYSVSVEFDGNRYKAEDIQCILECMTELATQAALHPDYDINRLSLLSAEQETECRKMASGDRLDIDESATFISTFIAQAAETPDAIAVKDESGEYTYAELDNLTNALAQHLVGEGVKKNNFVSIMLGYQKEFLIAAIGIEKSGGAYVPLDYDYPNDRLQFMLEDSESKVLVTSHTIFEEKNAQGEFSAEKILFIDDFLEDTGTQNYGTVNLATPEGLAYMIYTSGSTGKPKGVMIPHRAKHNFVSFIAKEWGHSAKSRICCHSSFSFDASIEDLYPVLTVGGTLYVVPQEARKDMELLHDFIISNNITGGCYTTQLGQLLLQQYPDLPLDYLVVGGEKMTANPDCRCRLINTYGPTEFTVDATYYTLERGREYRNIPIGRPLDNLTAYVLDIYGHPLPKGVAGELCMAGPQMASGYWKREELTHEKFSDVTVAGETLKVYHTGDLVKYNQDNQLEYLGRIDNQVKLRGFRIELGEIESRMASFANIKMGCVVVKTVAGTQHLCAYYSATEEIDKDALREHLAETLTEYMVPTVYTQLDEMPLTPNGKVDRKVLPAPRIERMVEYVAPESDVEQKIADTIKDVLDLDEPVGRNDGFYVLGGDSIKAIRIVAGLKKSGLSLTVAQIIKYQTVSALAEIAECMDGNDDYCEYFDLMPLPVEESFSSEQEYESIRAEFAERGETIERAYPLTSMQQGMLLVAMSDSESSAYHSTDRIKLGILPTEEQLSSALTKLLSKHEVLRTSIIYNGVAETRQAIISGRTLPLSFVDISSEEDPDAAAQRIDDEELTRHIDLQWDALLRLVCIKTSDTSCQLLFVNHHAIIDGWCNAIWMGDFFRFLLEAVTGEEQEEDFSGNHGRYERHVRDITSRDKDSALDYWKELLEGYETKAEIPAYEKITDETPSAGNEVKQSLPAETTSKLEKLCRDNGCTVNNAVEAAWGLVLQAYNRTDDAVFVKVVSGRDNSHEDMSDVVGLFINSVPVRVKRGADETLLDMVIDCQRQTAETNEYDWVPLSEIQQQSVLGANLFQIIIAFENFGSGNASAVAASSSTDILKARYVSSYEANVADISIAVGVSAESVVVDVKFDTKKYTYAFIKSVVDTFMTILGQMADTPSAKASSITLTDATHATELIALGTGDSLAYDRTETFVDMFLHHVATTPQATAVVDATGSLTFAELDNLSDALAAKLIADGVVPGDFVAVKMPRVKEFIVAVIASWKAGAAYVPVDPEYPADRITYMLMDSESRVLIDPEYCMGLSTEGAAKVNNAVAEKPAYMIYTSGSTGKPKGVVVKHANLRAFIAWIAPTLGLKAGDAVAHYISFSFDGGCCDLYPSIAVGGTLHILSEEVRKDVPALVGYLADNGIKGITLPTKFGLMVLEGNDLPVEYLVLGGEKNTGIRKTATRVFEMYGPTEFTVASSFHIIDYDKDGDRIPIGRPVPNSVQVIADANGNLVPRGMAGELCLSGSQLTNGYWQRPELTEKAFVKSTTLGGATMYRTGDLARWNEQGELEYLGRIDNQVKLRGFRIELGEIESALSGIEGITAAVAEVKTINGIQHLVGYYVAEEAKDEDMFRAVLSQSLTEYMVPDAFVHLERLPLTPVGKVDRKALPVPEIKEAEMVLPETPTEKVLYTLATDVLKNSDFGVTDDLFRFGMTSILGMRLVMMAEKHGLNFKLNDLVVHRNIRATLQQSSIMASWIKPFDPQKKVVVLVCGELNLYHLGPYTDALSECFNVFAIDPLPYHYKTLFFGEADILEVVEMYSLVVDVNIPENTNISAFCAHCFGGEIAYRMAQKYAKNHDNKPVVQLLDSFWHTLEYTRQTDENFYKLLPNDVIERHSDILKGFLLGGHKWDILNYVDDPTPYEGKIVYFRATEAEPMSNEFMQAFGDDAVTIFNAHIDSDPQKNICEYWRKVNPSMEVQYISSSHMNMLKQEFVHHYQKWLLDNL